MGPAALGQTIAVFDKSGKVVTTSKTLYSVFNDAKAAYHERKKELLARRNTDGEVRQIRRGMRDMDVQDDLSVASSRHSHAHKSKSRPKHKKRHPSDSHERHRRKPSSEHGSQVDAPRSQQLVRRHTTTDASQLSLRHVPMAEDSQVDMDLAYGSDVPPPSPGHRSRKESQLFGLMSKADFLLDEAHCVQHSVTKMIQSLQERPEALAAVALTLAEISSLTSKMGPGALTALKASFPRVIALLASPQFMIAAGLGVGILVVALGGFKVVKKMRNGRATEVEELREIGGSVNRIESWRRGVSDADTASVATSVDGEFITPRAAAMAQASRDELRSAYPSAVEDKRLQKYRGPSSESGRTIRSERSAAGSEHSRRVKRPTAKKRPSGLSSLFS